MNTEQQEVHTFMVKAGQETPGVPKLPDVPVRILRVKLIAQELRELAQAYGVRLTMDTDAPEDAIGLEVSNTTPVPEDLVEALEPIYDATLDLLVVTVGNGVATGLNLKPGWDEVHDANMRKFTGGHRAPDGKWIKPANFRPPQLKPIIQAQLDAARSRAAQQALDALG